MNGLCPAGWLNEQSITKHWFQSVRTCPYSWATGLNSSSFFRRSNANQGIFLFKFVFLVDMFSACTAPLLSLKHFNLIDWKGRGQFFCVWWCCTQLFFFSKRNSSKPSRDRLIPQTLWSDRLMRRFSEVFSKSERFKNAQSLDSITSAWTGAAWLNCFRTTAVVYSPNIRGEEASSYSVL